MCNFTKTLFIAFVLLSTSCKMILFKMEGIKQPALENHASLARFLSSYGIDTSEILCFRDTTALYDFYQKKIGTPDARFFNREKLLVDYRAAESDCNAKVSPFIKKGNSINQLSPIQGEKIDDYLNSVVYARTGQEYNLASNPYDFYMVVYWAKYVGKVNKSHVLEWQELVQEAAQTGQKVKFILVSADYQSNWGISKSALPKI